MSGRDHAFLELAALPALGSALFAPRPVLLFSADGRRILFANAAGARFFGERRIEDLLDRRFSPALPATMQIARAARSLAPGAARLERIRFAVGAGLASHAAECRRIALPDGEPAMLVALPESRERPAARQAAEDLVAALAEEDCAVAVLDAEGAVLAERGGAAWLVDGEAAVAELVGSAARRGERLARRALRIGDMRRPAGLAVFEDQDSRFHLLVVGPGERVLVEPAAPGEPVHLAEPAAIEAPDVEPEPTAAVSAPSEAVEPPPLIDRAAAGIEVAEDATPEPAIASEAEVEPEAQPEPVSQSEPQPEPSGGFRFAPPQGPVRFVFQMDADGRFTFVSPDFADVVGPASAIAVGETWGEMAARLGLDPTGAVAGLIARRDTWSGVTLDWPAEDGEHFVAVDLAALPAFSRDRLFEGYRGFGVIRRSDRPEAPPAPVERPRSAMQPQGSNVIRLARALPATETDRLSVPEQDAFRRIAAALSSPSAPRPPAAAPQPPASEATAPETATSEAATTEPAGSVPSATGTPAPEAVAAAIPDQVAETSSDQPPEAEAESGPAEAPAIEPPPAEAPDAPFVPHEIEAAAADTTSQPEPEPAPAATEVVAETPPAEAAVPASPLPDPLREAELAHARQRIVELEAILDTATDGIIVVDQDARIERINRSAEALFGVESASVAGLRLPDLLAEESRQSALDYLDGLARNGVASVLNDGREVIARVPQGGLIPLFMTMGRLPETGKFCAVLRDITQWKNAEGELINARRAAESASMQKSDFLAKVSHEIRTPLNAIIGFSEVMMEERFGPIGTERYKEYLRDIHVSGAHLMSLLNDLLDLSKIEAGKLDLNFESVALNDIVMECVALMQPQANRERIIIRTSLSGQVPNVVADPRSIRQIVLNLVSNAVKFTLAGGQVVVSTAMEPHGEVSLRIRDTGIGMSEKDIETALKPFRQLSTSRERRSDGTGLGLPLTKALVEANRASFVIDSAVGQGTLIRITFPATRVLAG
ncbi:ATP-binding protein [Kaistia geumhonensis]|uniref:histidine kinase n=1 Tax=Kaistia geumhonensis TaxID=410839 RepID=A0ABU0M5M4_9HYPH|nr:ATP-binding protein [Kaistia geumhonensis]MCX5478647.1 ATP-binding protein [Kaistia geumhonensis]MDQ0516135.1 PAS domain S-box-containing protein [Kaistia geumhonensis]